jgi:hypothetical protein
MKPDLGGSALPEAVSFDKLENLFERLGAREKLHSVARTILKEMKPPAQAEQFAGEFAGEAEQMFACMDVAGNESIVFICDPEGAESDFACDIPIGFSCGNICKYAECPGEDDYTCNSDFDCGAGVVANPTIFDCSHFDCGENDPAGSSQPFGCDAELDFVCGGFDFDCCDDFECDANHVFICTNLNDCEDNFTCSGGKWCDEENICQGTEYGCDPPAAYEGPNDGNPGDFECGDDVGGAEGFNCYDHFTCAATDDFNCDGGGSFTCGDDAQQTDNFDCDAEFECYGTFSCISAERVDCDASGNPYECPGEYNLDPPE